MGNDHKPCCAAEALRRIRQIPINGNPTGICMLDECIAEVKTQDLESEKEIRILPDVEDEYARALFEEYKKSPVKR